MSSTSPQHRRRQEAYKKKPPCAEDRSEPIITTYWPKVRHLPQFPNTRYNSLETKCGQRGWFWSSGYLLPNEPKLPLCAKCKRMQDREMGVRAMRET